MLFFPPPPIDLAPYWLREDWITQAPPVVWSGSATSVPMSALPAEYQGDGIYAVRAESRWFILFVYTEDAFGSFYTCVGTSFHFDNSEANLTVMLEGNAFKCRYTTDTSSAARNVNIIRKLG